MRFRLAPDLSTLDDPEWRKRPLAEVNKNSGTQRKNATKIDWSISLLAKCRPMYLFAIYIKCMRISAGFPSWEGASSTISANGLRTNSETHTKHVSLFCGLLGASHTVCLVPGLGIGCIHNQHPIILDQCAECDLLKFVQIQIRVKQWTQA